MRLVSYIPGQFALSLLLIMLPNLDFVCYWASLDVFRVGARSAGENPWIASLL